jgi:hypothetical protein
MQVRVDCRSTRVYRTFPIVDNMTARTECRPGRNDTRRIGDGRWGRRWRVGGGRDVVAVNKRGNGKRGDGKRGNDIRVGVGGGKGWVGTEATDLSGR